jgi:TonB family protein
VEQPKPTPPKPDARERAQKQMAIVMDQLADLRDNSVLDKAAQTKNLTGKVGEATRSERSLLTSKVGASSGGINTAALSRGYGGGQGALSGHTTTQVTSAVLTQQAQDKVQRAAGSGKASRSEEEIALVFARNTRAIDALYQRALRDRPDLQGKVVLELTISPEGAITRCEIISSDLNDPELERKIVARVKSFRFEAKDVGAITVTKPIDFFPA